MANNKKYKVGKSKIQGKGVFSKQNLKPGDYIGKAHTINELYTDYDFTDLGRNHNHSENPNVQNVLIGNERHFVAIKPIKKGEELTTNYRLQPDLEQPEDFQNGGKMTPQKDGYRTYSPFQNLPYIDVPSNVIDTNNLVYDKLKLIGDNGVTKTVKNNSGNVTVPGAKSVREVPVKAQNGKSTSDIKCPPDYVNIDGKCVEKDSSEYMEMLDKGIVGTMEGDKFSGSKSLLKPVTVVASKDEDTRKFWNHLANLALQEDDYPTYEALATMSQKYGGPKVVREDKGLFSLEMPEDERGFKKYRPHFGSGKIHLGTDALSVGELSDDFISELAHQKQYKNKGGLDFALRNIPSFGRTVWNMISNLESPTDAYGREYQTPGSVEYEAHREIQPELEKEFRDILDDKMREELYFKNPGIWGDNPPKIAREYEEYTKSGDPYFYQKKYPKKKELGGWLKQYDDGGTTTITTTIPNTVNIDGEVYNTSSDEYKDMLNKGLVGTITGHDAEGTPIFSGNKSVLQPVSVLSSKDKKTQEFYDKLRKGVFTDKFWGDDEGTNWEAFVDLGKKYGYPHVELMKGPSNLPWSEDVLKNYPELRGQVRPNLNPITGKISLPSEQQDLNKLLGDYISELSHYTQKTNNPFFTLNLWGQHPRQNIYGYEEEYKTPGSTEYEAHKEIEPRLKKEFENLQRDAILRQAYYKRPGFFSEYKPKETFKKGGWLSKYQDGGDVNDKKKKKKINKQKQATPPPTFVSLDYTPNYDWSGETYTTSGAYSRPVNYNNLATTSKNQPVLKETPPAKKKSSSKTQTKDEKEFWKNFEEQQKKAFQSSLHVTDAPMGNDPATVTRHNIEYQEQAQKQAEKEQKAYDLSKQAYIGQASPDTPESEQRRKALNSQIAASDPDKYRLNDNGDLVIKSNATKKEWNDAYAIQTPELVQTISYLTPQGEPTGNEAGRVGAEFNVNINPVTGPAMSAGRLTQTALGQNPYGFNTDDIVSAENIVPALAAIGDVTGLYHGYGFTPGLKKIGQNIKQGLTSPAVNASNISENVANKIFKNKNLAIPEGVTKEDIQATIQKNIDWINSEEYINRRIATTGETRKQVQKSINDWTQRLGNTKFEFNPSKISTSIGDATGIYTKGKLSDKIQVKNTLSKEEFLNTLDHEVGHSLSPYGKKMNLYENYPSLKINEPQERTTFQGLFNTKPYTQEEQALIYLGAPEEQQVRGIRLNNRIREDLGLSQTSPISKEQFSKWVDEYYNKNLDNPAFGDVQDIINEHVDAGGNRSSIYDWLNKVWGVAPVIGVGAAAASKEEEPAKQKKGGWLKKHQNGGSVESRQAGYTNIPFKYNSAWGGQFAMGGSIPGSVGFTYARTQGIPSEGPYAKKTMPSAQNGDKYAKNKQQVIDQLSNLPIYSPDQRYSEYQDNIQDWTRNIRQTPVEVNYNAPAQGSSYYGHDAPSYDPTFPYQGTVQLDDRQFDNVQTPERVIGHELRHAAFDADKFIPQWMGDALYNTARNPNEFEQGAHQNKLRERASMLIGARQNALEELGLPPNAKLSEEQFNYWARQPLEAAMRTGRIPDQYNDVRETFLGARNATDVRNLMNFENIPQKKNGGMTYYQHGLDWKPKTISKNGSAIPKAQLGYVRPTFSDSLNVYNRALQVEDYFKKKGYTKGPILPSPSEAAKQMDDLMEMSIRDTKRYNNDPKVIKDLKKDIEAKKKQNVKAAKQYQQDVKNKKFPKYKDALKERREAYKKTGSAEYEDKSGKVIKGKVPYEEYYSETGPYQFEQREGSFGHLDLNAPRPLYDERIVPQNYYFYKANPDITNYYDKAELFTYDPLAVKPYVMRTEEEKIKWEELYGDKQPKQTNVVPITTTTPTNVPTTTPITTQAPTKYEGDPVFGPAVYNGPFIVQPGGYLMGYKNSKGEITYIKPEDYEKYAVPEYGRKHIEELTAPKKQKRGGWLSKYS